MVSKPTIIKYRKRVIKAMKMAKGASAMIHPDVHRIDGDEVDEVIQASRDWIDSKYRTQYENRRASHIGTIDEYFDALRFLSLGPHEHAMLTAHRKAPNGRMTATEISEAAGWEGAGPANIHYGYLGRRIAEYLELALTDNDDKYWTEALATFESGVNEWEMHPELAAALDLLNLK